MRPAYHARFVMRVVAVVLASQPPGAGHPSQLTAHHGETLLHRAARIAREVSDETVVIVPPGLGVADYVEDPDLAEGIASSIRLGVARAGEARVLITRWDQVQMTSDHLRALLAVDAPIVATSYGGTPDLPAAFAPRFLRDLMALRGDESARTVIEASVEDVRTVPFDEAGTDIDSR
jgi:molybdenum cofactor cytidylyltransferase